MFIYMHSVHTLQIKIYDVMKLVGSVHESECLTEDNEWENYFRNQGC